MAQRRLGFGNPAGAWSEGPQDQRWIDVDAMFTELYANDLAGAMQDGVTDDSAALTKALTHIGSTRASLMISGPMLIGSNITVPVNVQLLFVGSGLVRPGVNVVFTDNGPIVAGPWQIFDVSNSGAVVTGAVKTAEIPAEWFGAVADNATPSGAFISNALALALASGVPVRLRGGTYKTHDATLSLGGVSFTRPSILGTSKKQTILDYSAAGASFTAIKIRGGSGQLTGDVVRDLTLLGNSTSIALELNGACGTKAINVLFSTNAVGARWHNETSGSFTEFCTLEGCEWSNGCALPMEYKITSGNNSFHGSGPGGGAENTIVTNANNVIQADGTGCFVYNAPCNIQVFATAANATIFQNNNSVAPVPIVFSGVVSIETNASQVVTLGAGASVYFIGPIKIAGATNLTGANVVAGTLLRVKNVQVHVDGSTSFVGAESARAYLNLSDTTIVDCGMKNVHRLVDLNITFANYAKRYTLDVDFFGDGSTTITPIYMEMTQNSSVATAAVIPRVTFDSTTGGSGSPNFSGNTDGTWNIIAAFTNMTATGAFSGGETSVTFTGNWTHPTGTHDLKFSNGDVRAATLTNGSAGPFTWTGGLSSAATTTIAATMWPNSGVSAYVYETQQSSGLQASGHMQF